MIGFVMPKRYLLRVRKIGTYISFGRVRYAHSKLSMSLLIDLLTSFLGSIPMIHYKNKDI